MFKVIKRFLQNRFWKEKRTVTSNPVHESQNEKLLETVNSVGSFRRPTKPAPAKVLDLNDEGYTKHRKQLVISKSSQDELISPAQAAYDMAAALKGEPLTQEEKDELDKELPHIVSGNFALPEDFPDMFKTGSSGALLSQEEGRLLKDREYHHRKQQLLDGIANQDETHSLLKERGFVGEVLNMVADPSNGGLNSPEQTERCRQQLAARGLMMSGQASAFTTFNPKLGIKPNTEEAGDETYALGAEHVMSQEAASMYRTLCNLKHHEAYQDDPARAELFKALRALKSGEWEPAGSLHPKPLMEISGELRGLMGSPTLLGHSHETMRIPNEVQQLIDAGATAEEVAKYKLEKFDDLDHGLARAEIHVLSGGTPASKSVFHSGKSLQPEVNHLIGIDPGKFCEGDHAEIDVVVKKLGDEIDCQVTKVKVVKRRLKPLSKNEASKMSPRRRKKESKKVIEVSRGKHRG